MYQVKYNRSNGMALKIRQQLAGPQPGPGKGGACGIWCRKAAAGPGGPGAKRRQHRGPGLGDQRGGPRAAQRPRGLYLGGSWTRDQGALGG